MNISKQCSSNQSLIASSKNSYFSLTPNKRLQTEVVLAWGGNHSNNVKYNVKRMKHYISLCIKNHFIEACHTTVLTFLYYMECSDVLVKICVYVYIYIYIYIQSQKKKIKDSKRLKLYVYITFSPFFL